MKRDTWKITLGIVLIILSAIVYFIHFLIFRDLRYILNFVIIDIAFVFINVLIVTFVIDSLLSMRKKKEKLEKLNMLIGVFFSEIGTKLLVHFSDSDPNLDQIKNDLIVRDSWSDKEFMNISKKLRNYKYDITIDKIDFLNIQSFLIDKNDVLVRLLENPNLFEHESFTELLQAVFHLDEELRTRKNVKSLSEKDMQHIMSDIKRAYTLLVYEWIDYMNYLKQNYPYLFSLAMRLNPFDEKATPEIK